MDKKDWVCLLRDAIILSAVEDLKRAYKKRSKGIADDGVAQVERFFRSDWFNRLTDLDGELVLAKLRQQYGEG